MSENREDDFTRLMHADRLLTLGRLVAGVAHEIGNPLTGILTYAYLLRDSLPEADARREDLEVIIKETIRCREIVRGLLDFAREAKLKREKFDLNKAVSQTLKLVEKQGDFREVKFHLELDPTTGEMEGDPHQIEQVVLNLVLNGVDAMAKKGNLWVRTRPSGENLVELEVEDQGCGIPPENLEAIFEPFFTTKKDLGGTGLGLSICFGIVQNHCGEIKVESEPGKGTKFKVLLPRQSAPKIKPPA